MRTHSERLRRNAAVVGATGVLLGLLFLYPTSTNRTDSPTSAAVKPGVVNTGPATGVLTVNTTGLAPGTYTYLSTFPEQYAGGMKGTLTIK